MVDTRQEEAMVSDMTWNDSFLALFRQCLTKYQEGNQQWESYYSQDDLTFLESIGYQPREFFDFVEDFGDAGVPTESTALLIAAVRRDYFQVMQKGERSERVVTRDDIPAFEKELGDIPYLPRIIAKAQAKLRGELDPDLMFSCGGDRRFLSEHQIHPADFLRQVWAAGDDEQKVLEFVRASGHSR